MRSENVEVKIQPATNRRPSISFAFVSIVKQQEVDAAIDLLRQQRLQVMLAKAPPGLSLLPSSSRNSTAGGASTKVSFRFFFFVVVHAHESKVARRITPRSKKWKENECLLDKGNEHGLGYERTCHVQYIG